MSKSLQSHPIREIYKQLRFAMQRNGLETTKVEVTRRAGKFKYSFTGSPEQVVKANQLLAAWG